MVIVTEIPWTIREPSRDATRGPGSIDVGDRVRPSNDMPRDRMEWETPVAEATLHLVAAYRRLHEVVPETLPPWAGPSFREVCDYLCSTVVAMDELTATLWGNQPA
jgi:hypothetical protein